uniref:Uncharacterized protein n=1 Tax=Opuntia streptacantha TaxID=393608 RepID=A0A7C8ZEA1_OPUST
MKHPPDPFTSSHPPTKSHLPPIAFTYLSLLLPPNYGQPYFSSYRRSEPVHHIGRSFHCSSLYSRNFWWSLLSFGGDLQYLFRFTPSFFICGVFNAPSKSVSIVPVDSSPEDVFLALPGQGDCPILEVGCA